MLAPALMMYFIATRREAVRERRGEKKPVENLLLRSPGESLRRKLEEIDDEANMLLMKCLLCGAIVGIFVGQAYRYQSPGFLGTFLSGLIFFLAFEAYLLTKLFCLAELRRDYRLGLSGELAVGEELNRLMLFGCRVYHDFPSGPDWNIDHIIVASGGVFAIETKAFRKHTKNTGKGQRYQDVIYTGDALQFPGWTTKEPLEQARRNARELAKFLKSSTAEEVPVYPLVIPVGWFVVPKVKPPHEVMNVQFVEHRVLNAREVLDADQIQRICHQLDQKCRDVEF